MSLFSSFIFPPNSFLSWINKSALGLAGVWTGLILSCYFGISFRCLLYWAILSTLKSFPDNPPIAFYLFSESRKYSISSVPWNVFLFSLSVSVSIPYAFFSFYLKVPSSFGFPPKFPRFQLPCCLFFITDAHAHMLKIYIGKDSYLDWSVFMRENKRYIG